MSFVLLAGGLEYLILMHLHLPASSALGHCTRPFTSEHISQQEVLLPSYTILHVMIIFKPPFTQVNHRRM